MRVIGGEFRSRKLKSAPGLAVRPTPDRLRESLFNILAALIPDCQFVDLYAGSGAVGIEALSRGASQVVFVESSAAALRVLRDNLRALGVESRVKVVTGEVARAAPLVVAPGAIVFLDPPYTTPHEYALALAVLAPRQPALIIAQHSSRQALPSRHGPFVRYRIVKQGDNSLSFYRLSGPDDAADPAG